MPDGRNVSGCFTADFDLSEINKLRATQSFAFRDQYYNGQFRWRSARSFLPFSSTLTRPAPVICRPGPPPWCHNCHCVNIPVLCTHMLPPPGVLHHRLLRQSQASQVPQARHGDCMGTETAEGTVNNMECFACIDCNVRDAQHARHSHLSILRALALDEASVLVQNTHCGGRHQAGQGTPGWWSERRPVH